MVRINTAAFVAFATCALAAPNLLHVPRQDKATVQNEFIDLRVAQEIKIWELRDVLPKDRQEKWDEEQVKFSAIAGSESDILKTKIEDLAKEFADNEQAKAKFDEFKANQDKINGLKDQLKQNFSNPDVQRDVISANVASTDLANSVRDALPQDQQDAWNAAFKAFDDKVGAASKVFMKTTRPLLDNLPEEAEKVHQEVVTLRDQVKAKMQQLRDLDNQISNKARAIEPVFTGH
ncbi:hypothetical protein O9K51_10207 [Purpureocillium lavendulum]|uniref:DUF148 domain-containing protein n=1 Tax=Purpureocillium lavendulum TaxID=1247861 RepID=A0AB34FFX1_9HYPO|nr:hypothetical protein O9K51_10207 [Purpureocillium lavendulum]